MEVGAYHNGFCDSLATDIVEVCCGVSDSGPAYRVGTFSGCADDLHADGILQVVHTRDYMVAWSASLHKYQIGIPSLQLSFGRVSRDPWGHS